MIFDNQTEGNSEGPEANQHDAANQEEGNLDDQWDSEEGKQIHCGERKHCYEQLRAEKFDEEYLFQDEKRCNPCEGDEKLGKVCADGQQHVDQRQGGESVEHQGGDVSVAGMEMKHVNPPSRIQ